MPQVPPALFNVQLESVTPIVTPLGFCNKLFINVWHVATLLYVAATSDHPCAFIVIAVPPSKVTVPVLLCATYLDLARPTAELNDPTNHALAAVFAFPVKSTNLGNAKAAKIPNTAITTNSIKVKLFCFFMIFFYWIIYIKKYNKHVS